MADDATRSRLGRGLAALIGDVGEESQSTERGKTQRRLPIEFLQPNPRNPRRTFAESELAELASSIAERVIIQPVLVYDLKCVGSEAYLRLATEIIQREKELKAG